jgi:exopolyphosphatase / guanosine-5'-triphosphate,3'-diphosphate pyrophosphatase
VATLDQPVHPTAPAVVPRWEWRTFSDLAEPAPPLAALRDEPGVESYESYVLSLRGDASVKVRGGLLDTKVLRRVDATGLQLWVPTMKAAFPLDDRVVAASLAALGVPGPESSRAPYDLRTFLAELVGAREDLRVVEVHKTRRRSTLDGCMVELTEISAEGRATRTVALESPEPHVVTDTMQRLGLTGLRNTCVARGLKSLLDWEPSRCAVLDVGTNSVKFVLADRSSDAGSRVETDTAVVTRLGEGLEQAGELTPGAMARTVDAIAELVADARSRGPVEIAGVGTAGLRQAPNREVFLDAVLAGCGVEVEVISGTEEARLAYLAAVGSLPLVGERLLVFDSGGGSSQFTDGTPDRVEEQLSLDVGAVRLTERFGLAGAVSRGVVDAAVTAVMGDLDGLRGRPRPDMVIGIGGTCTNLASVRHGLVRYDPDVVHGTIIDLAEADRQIEDYRVRSAAERRQLPGLQPARAEVILGGACIVRAILGLTDRTALTVSDRGLRHGVLAERFGS